MGHLLWLLVLKYRNTQLTSCDSDPPLCVDSIAYTSGRDSVPTSHSPPSRHLIPMCHSADEAQMEFILPSLGNKFMCWSALFLVCGFGGQAS